MHLSDDHHRHHHRSLFIFFISSKQGVLHKGEQVHWCVNLLVS